MKECNNDWLYKNSEDNSSRYLLGTKGEKTLFVFGINPSTAKPDDPDNTIKKVQKIARNNNYDSWIMLNVYPKRETKFENLSMIRNENEHNKNIEVITRELSKHGAVDVWVAFGNHIYDRDYLPLCWKDIYASLSECKINWLAVKVNKSGAPSHPLYQKDNSKLLEFDMNAFVNSLK